MPTLDLTAFPESAQPHLQRLMAEPLLEPAALGEQIDTHLKLLREAFLTSPEVDEQLAKALSDSCLALVRMSRDDTPEEARRLIQVAAHYFALSADGSGDFSRGGLDDDREVVNVICGLLGREDLVIARP